MAFWLHCLIKNVNCISSHTVDDSTDFIFKCQNDSRLCKCGAMVMNALVLWLNNKACDMTV